MHLVAVDQGLHNPPVFPPHTSTITVSVRVLFPVYLSLIECFIVPALCGRVHLGSAFMEMQSTPDQGPFPAIPHTLAAHHASRLAEQEHLFLSDWLNISPSANTLANSLSPHQGQFAQQMYSSQPSLTPSSSAPYSGLYSDFSSAPATPGNMGFGSSQDPQMHLGQVPQLGMHLGLQDAPQQQQQQQQQHFSPQQNMMHVQMQMQMNMSTPAFSYNNFWDTSFCGGSSQGYRLPRNPSIPSPYLPTPLDFMSPSQNSQGSSMGSMSNNDGSQTHSTAYIPGLRYQQQPSLPVTPEVFNFMSTAAQPHSTNISPVLHYPERGNTPNPVHPGPGPPTARSMRTEAL